MARVEAPTRAKRFRSAVVALPFRGAETRGIIEQAPVRRVARRESIYRRLLALADLLSVTLALVLAFYVFGDDGLKPALVVAIPLVVVVAKLQGLYDRDALLLNKTTLDEAPKLFQAATLYTLVLLLNDSWLIDGQLGNQQVLGIWSSLLIMSVLGRTIARVVARELTTTERVIVLGDLDDTARLSLKLAENAKVNAEVVGRIALTDEPGRNRGDLL